jgi:hypothetical protein
MGVYRPSIIRPGATKRTNDLGQACFLIVQGWPKAVVKGRFSLLDLSPPRRQDVPKKSEFAINEGRLMQRAAAESHVPVRPRSDSVSRKLPHPLLRYCINLWVLLHFTAIIAVAGTMGPTAAYVNAVWEVFHPYLQFLFLNHGFNYFAPEPAPTNLLKFEAIRADGSVVKGQIPDPSLRPRLLYQRSLLLTEHIGIRPLEIRDRWYRSYALHICQKYGAAKVHLTHLIHVPLPMEMVRNGVQPDAPFTYAETDLGDFSCDEP